MSIKISAIPEVQAGLTHLLNRGMLTKAEYDETMSKLAVRQKTEAKRTLNMLLKQNDRDLAGNEITCKTWSANRLRLQSALEALG